MPLYEYQCSACAHRFERIVKFSDAPLKTCPQCGKQTVEQLISAPAVQFKGSGWYVTDYARKGSAPDASSSTKSEGGSDSVSASKESSSGNAGSSAPANSGSSEKSSGSASSSTGGDSGGSSAKSNTKSSPKSDSK
jgi:putative FmdB family regulatory protein